MVGAHVRRIYRADKKFHDSAVASSVCAHVCVREGAREESTLQELGWLYCARCCLFCARFDADISTGAREIKMTADGEEMRR